MSIDTDTEQPVKYADIRELRELGVTHEINRLVLHPLGLALETREDCGVERLGGIQDYRDDPEGVIYGDDLLNAGKANRIANLIEERGFSRGRELGFIIQPLPSDTKQLTLRILEPSLDTGPGMLALGAVGELDEGEEQRERRILHFTGDVPWGMAAAQADLVIDGNGNVVKDRDGLAPRPATGAELAAAELIS